MTLRFSYFTIFTIFLVNLPIYLYYVHSPSLKILNQPSTIPKIILKILSAPSLILITMVYDYNMYIMYKQVNVNAYVVASEQRF